MNLNLDIDSLPPEQAEVALTRLEAIKAQRAVENALAPKVPYLRRRHFHNRAATHLNVCSLRPTNRVRALRAAWNAPCTRPGAIPIGGAVGVSTSRQSAGARARRTRQRATPCSASLSAGQDSMERVQSQRMP